MPSDRDLDALDGIRLNIEAIRIFIEGLDFPAFASDLRSIYAVVRALEIISEASRRLSEETKDRHPDIPWRAIRDAGNVYRHAYSSNAPRRVWETASGQLDGSWTAVVRELTPSVDGPEP